MRGNDEVLAVAMQKDPVCGMMVDDGKAQWSSEHAGLRFVFCAAGCKARFDKEPARFAR